MYRVLIIPDVKGWATDIMAKNIKRVLTGKIEVDILYTKERTKNEFQNYDKIYYMIPGDIPTNLDNYKKIITTFHGGPGTEGQADELKKQEWLKDIKISYVSNQTKQRVKDYDLGKMWFTPHGIEKHDEKTNKTNENRLRCGWAGWSHYLLNKQANHRRGHWVMRSQQKLCYNLKIAAGSPLYDKHLNCFKMLYPDISADLYHPEQMKGFYKKINLYLIPDKFAGGPMPALEAGSYGIPLITTNCGLCGDIFIDNEHGLLVNNYEEFVTAIQYMSNNKMERIRMGANFKKWIMDNRTWEHVKKHWIEFFGG